MSQEFKEVASFSDVKDIMAAQAQQHQETVRESVVADYNTMNLNAKLAGRELYIKAFFRKNGGVQFSLIEVRKQEPFMAHSFHKGKHINENVDALMMSWVNAVPVVTSRGRFNCRYTFYPNAIPVNIGMGCSAAPFLDTDPVVKIAEGDIAGIAGLDPAAWDRVLTTSGLYGLSEVTQAINDFATLKRQARA